MGYGKSDERIWHLTRTGLAAAIIFVITFFLRLPVGDGYIHAGDASIFLASVILPMPYSAVAAVIGSGLADLACGYAVFLPATAVVKALMTLSFGTGGRILSWRNASAVLVGIFINTAGYYLASSLIYGSFISAMPEIVGNIAEGLCGGVIFFAVGGFLDAKPHLREALRHKNK